VKQATAAMRQFTILVTAEETIRDTARCDRSNAGTREEVCASANAGPIFADSLAGALSRSGFKVVRDRMAPYDVELAVQAGVTRPTSGGWTSVTGVTSWPECSGENCNSRHPQVAVYTYVVRRGEPKITTGLRKNDSGGWRQRFKPDDPRLQDRIVQHCNEYLRDQGIVTNWTESFDSQLVNQSELKSCFASHDGDRAFLIGRTLQEGESPEAVAAHVTNELATCDELEAFANALASADKPALPAPPPPAGCPQPSVPVQAQVAPANQAPLADNGAQACRATCQAQIQACYLRANGAEMSCKSQCSAIESYFKRSDCETACTGQMNQANRNCQADATVCDAGCR
jgi:hypothetical protein